MKYLLLLLILTSCATTNEFTRGDNITLTGAEGKNLGEYQYSAKVLWWHQINTEPDSLGDSYYYLVRKESRRYKIEKRDSLESLSVKTTD